MPDYIYDDAHTRYELVSSKEGKNYNWLFIPGGPGADSRYLYDLVHLLELPGNVWLIDFPGNGDNVDRIPENYNYNEWFSIFLPTIERFENPILVGHNFGGTFPLLFPELEEILKGFVILNGAPSYWFNDVIKYIRTFNLPDLVPKAIAFPLNPNQQNFQALLQSGYPFAFPPTSIEKAKLEAANLPFPFQPCLWWNFRIFLRQFDAEWIPEEVPTLIIGARFDYVMPFSLFRKDSRFLRPNIQMAFIENGGHLPWMDNPEAVKAAFKQFCERLDAGN